MEPPDVPLRRELELGCFEGSVEGSSSVLFSRVLKEEGSKRS